MPNDLLPKPKIPPSLMKWLTEKTGGPVIQKASKLPRITWKTSPACTSVKPVSRGKLFRLNLPRVLTSALGQPLRLR